MMNFDRIVMTCIVAHEVRPAPPVGVVWSTAVKEVTAEQQRVPWCIEESCSEQCTLKFYPIRNACIVLISLKMIYLHVMIVLYKV